MHHDKSHRRGDGLGLGPTHGSSAGWPGAGSPSWPGCLYRHWLKASSTSREPAAHGESLVYRAAGKKGRRRHVRRIPLPRTDAAVKSEAGEPVEGGGGQLGVDRRLEGRVPQQVLEGAQGVPAHLPAVPSKSMRVGPMRGDAHGKIS